jgi:hypothetical protein
MSEAHEVMSALILVRFLSFGLAGTEMMVVIKVVLCSSLQFHKSIASQSFGVSETLICALVIVLMNCV